MSHLLTNGLHLQQNPYEVSPPSSDAASEDPHESWPSEHLASLPRPAQRDHNQQDQNHGQQFAPNWPFASVEVPGLVNQHSSLPVPPNNTPIVTPEDSLEDVSLDGQNQSDHMNHQETEQQMRASHVRFASLPVPAQETRPSSFEIMSRPAPVHPQQLAEVANGHANQHGTSGHNGSRYGLDRVRTPYPAGIVSPTTPFPGTRQAEILDHPEVTAGGHSASANQDTVALQRSSQDERFGIWNLILLMASFGLLVASFVLFLNFVGVMSVFRSMHEPLNSIYVVDLVVSILCLFASIGSLIMVCIGKTLVFPFTLRFSIARRQPPQPKELELGSMSRSVVAGNRDVERGEVQHPVTVPQPVMPMPVRNRAGSRVQLLQAAAPNATVAPSTSQTSIVTELCDAVPAPDSRL
ncbi:hypothetical protein VPNG_09722 [Cytospora leucostoma]|uniref:Uncharacterized protein n=1 Tax=Cytospora leucostoma TaxID=1230097 RepID=A0A423VKL7_9PEZI|nr:hypothetical protein VPNG_09722 [Cytospora leucostoma]